MTRIAMRLPPILATIALVAALTAVALAESSDAGPRIVDCRIGWDGQYKVGYWTPMWVDVAGDLPAATRVEVTVPDPDGVQSTFTALPTADAARPRDPAGQPLSVLLYVKIGRVGSAVNVALVVDGTAVDRVTLEPTARAPGRGRGSFSTGSRDVMAESPVEKDSRPRLQHPHPGPLPKGEGDKSPFPGGEGEILPGLPSTAELMVAIGPIDLSEAFPNREADRGELVLRTAHLQHVADLPTQWFGYEGVDTLVLSTGDLELSRQLAADRERLAALEQWVRLGGRLIVLWGQHAPELLAEGEPLATLAPGTFVQTVRLTQTSPLEHFSQSEIPVARGDERGEVVAVQLRDVAGRIDAFAGGKPTDLPLVVRAPRGMGELGFVGVDFDTLPLADWQGQTTFLRALLQPYTVASDAANAPQTLVTLGYSDLSGALRQQLGRSFPSVTTVTFPTVALLVIGYLVLLGPVDYFLVRKCGQQHWVAWVTFPLLVVATSGGAYWLAETQKGGVSVNQLELVDVDLTTGETRGTYWGVLYSPQARRYDLALDVHLPGGRSAAKHQTLLSWLGLPGTGLGGMNAANVDLGIITDGYQFAPKLDALDAVPLLTSSTKSLLARWTAPVEPLVSAQLAEVADGLLTGTLTNQTGQTLTDARLLYGSWAYRLGDLPSGRPVSVDQSTNTMQVKTLIAHSAHGGAYRLGSDAEREPFLADRASDRELLSVMMFYQAAGGYGFAKLVDQYQSYCDFSRLLDLGRAILVADGPGTGSTLIDQTSGKPLHSNEDQTKVVYRFVLPVEGGS
jgi:hypothetical protein